MQCKLMVDYLPCEPARKAACPEDRITQPAKGRPNAAITKFNYFDRRL